MRSFFATSLLFIAVTSTSVAARSEGLPRQPGASPDGPPPASAQDTASLRKQAWEVLDAGVNDKSRDKRARAVGALGMVGNDAKAVQAAEAALQDKEFAVRAAAARTLGEMHSTSSVPKLVTATQDKHLLVAVSAASALLAMKQKAGYETFYSVLTGERKAEGMIAQQANDLKDPKKATEFAFEEGVGFVPFAGAGFEAIRMLTKKDPSPVRAAAATALADDPDPRCTQALIDALKDNNWIVRLAVVRAMVKRGDASLIESVASAMTDKKEEVRLAGAAAVLRLSGARSPATKTAQAEPPK